MTVCLLDEEHDDQSRLSNVAKAHYSEMRNRKQSNPRKLENKQKQRPRPSIFHFNPDTKAPLDSDGMFCQNYRNEMECMRFLERSRRKLYDIVLPHIRELKLGLCYTPYEYRRNHYEYGWDHFVPKKISVECVLNDFWIRLW